MIKDDPIPLAAFDGEKDLLTNLVSIVYNVFHRIRNDVNTFCINQSKRIRRVLSFSLESRT